MKQSWYFNKPEDKVFESIMIKINAGAGIFFLFYTMFSKLYKTNPVLIATKVMSNFSFSLNVFYSIR